MNPTETAEQTDNAGRLRLILEQFHARAAGLWRLDPDQGALVLMAFAPGTGLDEQVARDFAAATALVPMDRPELGIVKAVLEAAPAVSIASQLNPEMGSGYWLRAFDAERSIAVPLRDTAGTIRGVASVALADPAQETLEVVERFQRAGFEFVVLTQ